MRKKEEKEEACRVHWYGNLGLSVPEVTQKEQIDEIRKGLRGLSGDKETNDLQAMFERLEMKVKIQNKEMGPALREDMAVWREWHEQQIDDIGTRLRGLSYGDKINNLLLATLKRLKLKGGNKERKATVHRYGCLGKPVPWVTPEDLQDLVDMVKKKKEEDDDWNDRYGCQGS